MVKNQKMILPDSYQYLLEKFEKGRIESRYNWVYSLMSDFIEAEQIADGVLISTDILNHVIVDYFVDIDRLKDFQSIEKVHDSKIYAYLSFWILRHKPIQVVKEEDAAELAFINEKFVCCLLRSYLFSEPENVPIMNNKKEVVDNFIGTLLYYLKYRDYSAKSIEILILLHISYGKISSILAEASERAEQFDARIPLEGITKGAKSLSIGTPENICQYLWMIVVESLTLHHPAGFLKLYTSVNQCHYLAEIKNL